MQVSKEEAAVGLFEALRDFSFNHFVTTKIIKLLYIIGLSLGTIGAAVGIITGLIGAAMALGERPGSAILSLVGWLILVPILWGLFVLYLRVSLEILVVVFRIADNTHQIAQRGIAP
jgi:Domain of unknown function (DUF4282)